jgi:sulfite reductase (NADPH) hemoprotein beta-component
LFRENVQTAALIDELRPVLTRFARERVNGERFGDFCARTLWNEATAAPN